MPDKTEFVAYWAGTWVVTTLLVIALYFLVEWLSPVMSARWALYRKRRRIDQKLAEMK